MPPTTLNSEEPVFSTPQGTNPGKLRAKFSTQVSCSMAGHPRIPHQRALSPRSTYGVHDGRVLPEPVESFSPGRAPSYASSESSRR